MNHFYQFILAFSIFATGVAGGMYAGLRFDELERTSLVERLRESRQERDEWKKRHADLMEQWEREKRPRPFRSETPETHVMHLDHTTWGAK